MGLRGDLDSKAGLSNWGLHYGFSATQLLVETLESTDGIDRSPLFSLLGGNVQDSISFIHFLGVFSSCGDQLSMLFLVIFLLLARVGLSSIVNILCGFF